MNVVNIHERVLSASKQELGALIDSLGSSNDRLWPNKQWPKMTFDQPLAIGAQGGHGPIRYYIETYIPGRFIKFRFTSPKGFDGFHAFDISSINANTSSLIHIVKMKTRGLAILFWPLIFAPLHDALLEDCLLKAQTNCGLAAQTKQWSLWVRLLRWVFAKKKQLKPIRSDNNSNT